MTVLQFINTVIILWIISLVAAYMFNLQFKMYDLVQWSWLEIRLYQEPQRSMFEFGCSTTEHGWKNPLFVLHLFYWSIDLELIFHN